MFYFSKGRLYPLKMCKIQRKTLKPFQMKDYKETWQLTGVSDLRLDPVLQNDATEGITEPLIELSKSPRLVTALRLFKKAALFLRSRPHGVQG